MSSAGTKRMSWKVGAALVGAALLASTNLTIDNDTNPYLRRLEADGDSTIDSVAPATTLPSPPPRPKRRPVIHTFFERIPPSERGAPTSDATDVAMLKQWRTAWQAAGWEPKILNLEDAKRHPQYGRYAAELEAVPMMGRGGTGANRRYHQLCFLRWLAMAADGGGWMSDYDVYPLYRVDETSSDDGGIEFLPEGGAFTVHSAIKDRNGPYAGVPSLMSGTADEWTRMADTILWNGLRHKTEPVWTDFFALVDVKGTYKLHDRVVSPDEAYTRSEGCKNTIGKHAVHFSPAATEALMEEGQTAEDRPGVIRKFLVEWSDECVTRDADVPFNPSRAEPTSNGQERNSMIQTGFIRGAEESNTPARAAPMPQIQPQPGNPGGENPSMAAQVQELSNLPRAVPMPQDQRPSDAERGMLMPQMQGSSTPERTAPMTQVQEPKYRYAGLGDLLRESQMPQDQTPSDSVATMSMAQAQEPSRLAEAEPSYGLQEPSNSARAVPLNEVAERTVPVQSAQQPGNEVLEAAPSAVEVQPSRPVMHTFFQRIDPDKKGTSMSDEADEAMLEQWKDAWLAAGWEPKVLSLEDAERHPAYETYVARLEEVPMMGSGGQGKNKVYNQLCFLRWLAMAAAGGGWMSDYDVFPLHRAPDGASSEDLPEDGRMIVHSSIPSDPGAGVPCLVSGRPEEWLRMADALLENGIRHKDTATTWTDFFALIDLKNTGAYEVTNEVIYPLQVISPTGLTEDHCAVHQEKMAVHFSHASMDKLLREGETMDERPNIIRKFLSEWNAQCWGATPI